MAGAQPPHLDELGIDGVAVDIGRLTVFVEGQQPAAADLGDALGARHEADHQRAVELQKLARGLEAGDQRDVGGADAAIGKIDAGRSLRRAADADENDFGFVEILWMLAIIMQHRVVEGLDSLEILGIEDMLAANMGPRLGVEIGGKAGNDRVENRQAGDAERVEAAFETAAQRPVGQGEEHNAGLAFDLLDHPVELLGRAHQGIYMLDRLVVGVIGGGGTGHGVQGLAGGIGDEMHVEDLALMFPGRHGSEAFASLWRRKVKDGRSGFRSADPAGLIQFAGQCE